MNYFRCGGGRSTHTATKIDVAKTPLATFESNVSGLYIPEILAYITATQAGTGDPSPSNPRAISGWSSVSVADITDSTKAQFFKGLLDGTYGFVDLGSLSWFYQPNYTRFSANADGIKHIVNVYTIPNIGSTIYTAVSANKFDNNLPDMSIRGATTSDTIFVRNTAYTDAQTFQTAMSGVYIIYELATPTTPTITKAEFEMLLTAFGINGTTATTSLGGTYYGGYLNVTTGLLTLNWGMLDLSSVNWELTTNRARTTTLNGLAKIPSSTAIPANMKAEKYLCIASSGTLTDGNFAYLPINNVGTLLFYYDGVNKPTDKLIYELATPQTVQLTPAQLEQLLGQNNVFCSTGDVAVKYWKID